MTEEEAKTKRCPAPMGTMSDARTQNHCIGSQCMAWRDFPWVDTRSKHLIDKKTGKRITGGLSWESEWVLDNPDEPAPPKHGYCGLAGKP